MIGFETVFSFVFVRLDGLTCIFSFCFNNFKEWLRSTSNLVTLVDLSFQERGGYLCFVINFVSIG